MSNQKITLNKLFVRESVGGEIKVVNIKIEAPTPCEQPNSQGSFKKFEDLAHFRKSARYRGAAFRAALESGS